MKTTNIKIKKEPLIHCIIITIFWFILLIISNVRVNAYYSVTDPVGSSTLKIDKDDYYDINLLDNQYGNLSNNNSGTSCGVSWSYDPNTYIYTFNGTITNSNCWILNVYRFNIPNNTSNNINWDLIYYYISGSATSTNGNMLFRPFLLKNGSFSSSNAINIRVENYTNTNGTNLNTNNYDYISLAVLTQNYSGSSGVTFNNLKFKMLVTNQNYGGANIRTPYSLPFKFGYKITNNYTANNFTYTLIDNYDNTKTYTLNNNSSIYVPFQYQNNKVTFSYSVKWNTSTNIYNGAVDLKFIPIFSGTLKENNENILQSHYSYLYNYLFLKNFKFSNLIDVNLGDLFGVEFNINNYDNKQLIIENDSLTTNQNIISNYTSAIKQTNIINKDIYFNGTDSIYTFDIVTNLLTPQNNQLVYSINIDSIGIGVMDSIVNNTFETNNQNDLEYYPVCGSIFEDFGCNLNNAATYIIFNIPILGPVIGFIKDMYTIFSNLITAMEWYQSLGILFGIFILIMFLKILSILWKGKDE